MTPMPIIKTCVVCGGEFIPRAHNAMICSSPDCRKKKHADDNRQHYAKCYRHPPPPRACIICGKIFAPRIKLYLMCSSDCRRVRVLIGEIAARRKQATQAWRKKNKAHLKAYGERARSSPDHQERRRITEAAYRAAHRDQQRELYGKMSLAYQLLKRRGVAPDHLPTLSRRQWFAYRQLRRYPGVLTTTTNQQEND